MVQYLISMLDGLLVLLAVRKFRHQTVHISSYHPLICNLSDDLSFSYMCSYRLSVTNAATLQLKSSLLLHVDGTSGTAEDIGRQVCSCFKFLSIDNDGLICWLTLRKSARSRTMTLF